MMVDVEEFFMHTMPLNAVERGLYAVMVMTMWRQPYARLRDDDDILWKAAGQPDKRTWRHVLPKIRRMLIPVGNDGTYVTTRECKGAHARVTKYVNASGKSGGDKPRETNGNVVTFTNTNTSKR